MMHIGATFGLGDRLRVNVPVKKVNPKTIWVKVSHSKHVGQKPYMKFIKLKRSRVLLYHVNPTNLLDGIVI